MWLEYLKECLFDEIDIVLNLAGIDQQVQGEKNEVNDIISLLNDNIENLSFYDIKDKEVLLDGNPWVLIKVLNDLVEKSNRVVVTKTNLAINKWIVERYKDFLVDNGANYNVNLEITDNFEINKSVIVIGHKEFVKEMEECLDVDIQTIIEEF
jgi:hypothetical protein